ncbi:MAG TPA: permease, partial [Acidobacteria bacterium]|nr:permease [Acidobacteriota bacterium]
VLLVASANVASLLVVQATARRREIAIRAALGAARGRVVQQLLTESVLLAVIGGGLGFLVATWALGPIRLLLPPDMPRLDSIAIDPTVLGFAVLVSMAVGALFGLGPSLGATRRPIASVLQEGSTTTVGGLGANRGRSAMIVAEVAVSVVLLVGAALLLSSYARLLDVERGFDAERVLVFSLEPPPTLADGTRVNGFYDQLLGRLRALPGVDAAAVATAPPFRGLDQSSFRIPGRDGELRSLRQRATPAYFAAMGIRLVRGRLFDARDALGTPSVLVVNERMAAAFWPGADPIGQQIVGGGSGETYTIVGVVADARYVGLDEQVQPFRYLPLAQEPWTGRGQIILRTANDLLDLAAAARAAVWEIDREAAVSEFDSMAQLVARSVATPRFRTLLLTLLALVAVGLTVVGVYGVISYTVARSTRDIAVKMALGAAQRDVVSEVCRLGGRLIAVGVVVGLGAAFAATQLLEAYLFEVQATDPGIFAVAATLVAVATAVAIIVPASRAARVDPMVALRAE